MTFQIISTAQTLLKSVAVLVLLFVAGCSSAKKNQNNAEEVYLPRVKWYAHCETCNWCRGSFKNTQEVQWIVSEHNKQLHDWIKVAYYDQNNCRK